MIDTLVGSFDIKDYDKNISLMAEKLSKKKAAAKSNLMENNSDVVFIKIGDMTFEVLPNGRKGYSYILHNDLYEVDLAQYRSMNENFFPVFIRCKSEVLWSSGPKNAWDKICEWTSKYIGEIINNKASRIDLCCHTDRLNLGIEDVKRFKGRYYTDSVYSYRRKLSGIYFGSKSSGKVFGRVYDKSMEVKQKKTKTWFYRIWNEAGLDKDNVWNVEFQLNREFLKEHYIDTVWNALDKLQAIWKYCTENWLVLTDLDATRIERSSVSEEWQLIQKAFKGYYGTHSLVKREHQVKCNVEQLVPQTFGNITTICAKLGISDMDFALRTLKLYGNRYYDSKRTSFTDVVKDKKKLVSKQENIPDPYECSDKLEMNYE